MRYDINTPGNFTRRDFMKTGTAAAFGAALATSAIPRNVFAEGSDTIKIGLVGCGGRGSGAANDALSADENIELVAMGDMFPDKLDRSHKNLVDGEYGDRVRPQGEMKKFTGFDAYKGVIENCDVVLLATPPHFRPIHLRAAVDAGKHVFCEKPVGVDVPGVKKVMEAVKIAKEKKLTLVSGLCYRYEQGKNEIVKRIHDGALGDILTLQTNYNGNGLWSVKRTPDMDEMQYQLRNWLYYHWLSGDHCVEQAIHSVDKMMWVMNDAPPAKISAAGGRVQRTAPEFGNIYDHFNAVIEWPTAQRCYFSCRQWNNVDTDISDWVYGTQGKADYNNYKITGKLPWQGEKGHIGMYQAEHIAMYKSIRNNEARNNGDYMVSSTLVAMMIRMSAYTGRTIYWDKAAAEASKAGKDAPILLESVEDLSPAKYAFGPLPVPAVAVPGQKFI